MPSIVEETWSGSVIRLRIQKVIEYGFGCKTLTRTDHKQSKQKPISILGSWACYRAKQSRERDMVPAIVRNRRKNNNSLRGQYTPTRKENKDWAQRTFFQPKSGETMEWVTKGGERSKKQPDLQKKIKKSHRESRPREIESRAEEKCQMRGHCTITIYHLQEPRGLTDDHRTRTRTRAGFNS